MDYGNMVGESFEYAKDAVVGKWNQWLMLIIATILLGLPLMGYSMKVLRGEKPAPEVADWGTLFVDGIKYLIVVIIWAIPFMIVYFLTIGAAVMAMMSGDMAGIGAMMVGLLIAFIVGIVTAVFALIGVVRFARTGAIGEAFNFTEILATIAKIGWVPYIIALVVLIVVDVIIGIIVTILMMIPILGFIIYLCLIAPIALFFARYICQLYDSAGAA
jgi:hypothetical protein